MRTRVTMIVLVGLVGFAATSARAYQVKQSSRGMPLRWAEGELEIDIAMDHGPEGIDRARAASAIEAAFETWGDAIPAAIDLVTRVKHGKPPAPDPHDRTNLVRWVSSNWNAIYEPDALAVTLTTYEPESGEITDADIVINAEKYRWVAGDGACAGAYDLQNVITHEVGHLFGLAHDPEHRNATMYPSSPTCETKKRDLDDDDLAGLHYLYSEVGPASAMSGFGCAAASGGPGRGGAGVISLLLVAAAILLAVAKRRGRREERPRPRRAARGLGAIGAGVLVAILPSAASATTARRFSLAELTEASTIVARGKVVSERAWRDGSRVYTDDVVRVSECWRGACGRELTLRQLGGEADGIGISVEGVASLDPGDEVVVFLRAGRDGAFAPVGMAQGVFHVARTGRLVRDVRGLAFVRGDGEIEAGTLEDHALDDVRRVTCKGRCR